MSCRYAVKVRTMTWGERCTTLEQRDEPLLHDFQYLNSVSTPNRASCAVLMLEDCSDAPTNRRTSSESSPECCCPKIPHLIRHNTPLEPEPAHPTRQAAHGICSLSYTSPPHASPSLQPLLNPLRKLPPLPPDIHKPGPRLETPERISTLR